MTGGESLNKNGCLDEVRQVLRDAGMELLELPSLEVEPGLDYTVELAGEIHQIRPDVAIGIGGGSILDAMKAALVFDAIIHREGPAVDLTRYFPGPDAPPLPVRDTGMILLPTTAGTGSEVTPYASLKLESSQKGLVKKSLTGPQLFADLALVDPELTWSCPSYLTACAGMDALSQSLESYWSRNARPTSRLYSLAGLKLVWEGLWSFAADPEDKFAREKLARGAYFSGVGIAHAQTTAVHATSYPLTTLFGIPHGHACALTLAEFTRYNADFFFRDEGKPVLDAFGVNHANEAADKISELMGELALETRLSKLGVKAGDLDRILATAFRPDRAGNNPVAYEAADLRRILGKVL